VSAKQGKNFSFSSGTVMLQLPEQSIAIVTASNLEKYSHLGRTGNV
jgi:hypothetical protein